MKKLIGQIVTLIVILVFFLTTSSIGSYDYSFSYGSGGFTWLLKDEFITNLAAGSVNGTAAEPGPGTRTVRDVESKLALSSGWGEWTAQDTPAYADQDMVFANVAIARVAGKVILNRWRCSTDNPHYPLALVSSTTPTWNHTHVHHAFWRSGALVLSSVDNVAVGPRILDFVAGGTIYQLAMAVRSTGTYYFIKGGAFTSWTLLHAASVSSTTPLYVASSGYTAVFSTDQYRHAGSLWLPTPLASDGFGSAFGTTDGLGHAEGVAGGLGSGGGSKTWTGATWSVSSGKAVNTPTLGSELYTTANAAANPDSTEANDTTGFTGVSGASFASEATDPYIGSYNIIGTASASAFNYIYTTATTPDNYPWVRVSAYGKNVSATSPYLQTHNNATGMTNLTLTSSYQQYLIVFRGISNTPGVRLSFGGTPTAGWQARLDSVSIKQLSLPTLFASIAPGTTDPYASVKVTIPSGRFQSGLVLNLDSASSPANFIIVYYNRADNKVCMDKCLGGTYTNVIAGVTATYSAGAPIVCRKIGLSYYVWYNNAYIGNWTANAVTDANIVNNTKHGLFNTGEPGEVQLDDFILYPSGSGGEYNYLNVFTN